jgi:hypothetical protein
MTITLRISESVWLEAMEVCWNSIDEPEPDLLKTEVLRGDEDGLEYLALPWICRKTPAQVRHAVDAFRSLSFQSKLFFLPMFMVSYVEDPNAADVGLEAVAEFIKSARGDIVALPGGPAIAGLILVYLLCRLSNEPIEDEICAAQEFT